MELIFRDLMGHVDVSFVIVPMAGIVYVVLMALEDRKWHPLLSSFYGALTITMLELIVGSIALWGFGHRFWRYGRLTFYGIIALDWAFIWWGICLVVVSAHRLIYIWLKKRKDSSD